MQNRKQTLRGPESLEVRVLLAADLTPLELEFNASHAEPHQHYGEAQLEEQHVDGQLIFDGEGSYYFDPAPPEIKHVVPDDGGLGRSPLNVPILHSNPSATKKILLDFDGQIVTGTSWNNVYNNGNPIHAQAYSTDSDTLNFSASELANIQQIFLRVAEDFAPFNVDVTTEDPGSAFFAQGNQGIRVVISTDVDSAALGGTGNRWFSGAGGVAYLNSWSRTSDTPVWVFENNLSNGFAKYVAEAASHETGHALALSHDGGGGDGEYYSGHGSGATSWAPIMGNSYDRNVTQWSRGEYNNPSNTENDLAIMTVASRIPYRGDDHSNSITNVSAATPLVAGSGGAVERVRHY